MFFSFSVIGSKFVLKIYFLLNGVLWRFFVFVLRPLHRIKKMLKNAWKNFPFDRSNDAQNLNAIFLISSSVPNQNIFWRHSPRTWAHCFHRYSSRPKKSCKCSNDLSQLFFFFQHISHEICATRSEERKVGENPKRKEQNKIVSNSFALAKCDRAENVETITTHRARLKRKI